MITSTLTTLLLDNSADRGLLFPEEQANGTEIINDDIHGY
jgi:hypothetical protein